MAIDEHQALNVAGAKEEIVTCKFIADAWIDEVYYNNEDIRGRVKDVNKPTHIKELKFSPKDGGVLAIATNDNEPGTSAVFCFKCSSTNPNSYWNFELAVDNVKLYEVRSYGIAGSDFNHGPLKRPPDKQPYKDWYKNDFDDSMWSFPTDPTNDFLAKSHEMSGVWYKEYKYAFYRFNPRKVNLEHLDKVRKQKETLHEQVSSLVKEHGYSVVDMKFQMSFDDGANGIHHTNINEVEEVVTCQFVAEGWIDEVYYDDKDIRDMVKNVNSSRELLKTLKFSPRNNGVLAIAANANAFGFQCSSTNPDSYWNFSLAKDNCRLYEVRASGIDADQAYNISPMERPLNKQPERDWYMKDFDDSLWEYPSQPVNDFLTKFHHMSRVWHKQCQFTFFRFDPQKVDLESLAKEREAKLVLNNEVMNLAKGLGFNIVGLKVQKNEAVDVGGVMKKKVSPMKETKQPVSQKILNYVANKIASDWKFLGRNLGLDESKIEQINLDNFNIYERSLMCQQAWIKSTKHATWTSLKIALAEIPRNDIIGFIEEKFGDLIPKDFENGGKFTFFTRRQFSIDTSIRLDLTDDTNKFPKIYQGTMWKGLEEVPIAAKTFIIENDDHREKLKANANLMYGLRKDKKCKNIVNLIDYYEEESKQFILIFERCDFDMKQYLGFCDVGVLPLKTKQLIEWTKPKISSLQIAKDIIDGLEYVHSNHGGSTFMHRDIKPSNILFKINGNKISVKISDFGITKKSAFSRNSTTTCLDKGTDLYVPKDIREKAQIKLKEIDIADLKMGDMFAFGVTLHQLLTGGRHPFEGKSEVWTSCNMEEGIRTVLFELKNKLALNLICNLTESNPNDRLTATEIKTYHPWLFDHEKIIVFLKELECTLSNPKVDSTLKNKFEESRLHLPNGGEWRCHLPKEFSENFGRSQSNPDECCIPEGSLKDQITYVLNIIDSFGGKNNNLMKNVFGKSKPSNEDIISYLITGENALFPSFFIHVYCEAVHLFPFLSNLNNDGPKKIRQSYNRYLDELKKWKPIVECAVEETECDTIYNNVDSDDINGKKKDSSLKNRLLNTFRSKNRK